MTTLTTSPVGALRVAHLDHMTGVGMLACPPVNSNVFLGSASVNGADWDSALRVLDGMGWEVLGDENGLPVVEGVGHNGGEVVALYGRAPITSRPDMSEIAEAGAALASIALAEKF
ncbi:hypothetical protein [Nocardioides jishulii]|uniref:Uncharacterized protein n=1 Tax=Nocardioides jishulii TaxID=2575440 RepID=A0A4U2YT22_9ACTN|nr:hypothetical protein [Nocardioides jishulii]QCX26423.1 hypothetical protein FCL41_01850 [Nocardioides jishulii]TKI63772.1 hypothetical protein FC770_00855 [Nocardioides jishulii]